MRVSKAFDFIDDTQEFDNLMLFEGDLYHEVQCVFEPNDLMSQWSPDAFLIIFTNGRDEPYCYAPDDIVRWWGFEDDDDGYKGDAPRRYFPDMAE